MKGPTTVGYHAPPPGAPTGVADYAQTLLRALRAAAPAEATVERDAMRADVHLYHLGNNRLHSSIYARALATPGIVVIHDAVLQHFLLGTLQSVAYVEEFVYNYGEWRRHLGDELWRERSACSVDPRYFRYPMLRRAVERARAVIVHNPGAAQIVREHNALNVHVIPHFFERDELPDAAATAQFRQRIGVEHSVTLFGIFGYLRETKRILPCIRAFRRLHAERPATALLIAGEVVSGDLRRLLDSEAGHPAIHRLGHLSDSEFRTAAAAVDCCLNLRYPPAGETSGIGIRLMGMGRTVILTEGEETSDIPVGACLRVAADADETIALMGQMALVTDFPRVAREIGAKAARHIQRFHTLHSAVDQYWEVIDSVIDQSPILT